MPDQLQGEGPVTKIDFLCLKIIEIKYEKFLPFLRSMCFSKNIFKRQYLKNQKMFIMIRNFS